MAGSSLTMAIWSTFSPIYNIRHFFCFKWISKYIFNIINYHKTRRSNKYRWSVWGRCAATFSPDPSAATWRSTDTGAARSRRRCHVSSGPNTPPDSFSGLKFQNQIDCQWKGNSSRSGQVFTFIVHIQGQIFFNVEFARIVDAAQRRQL